MRNGEPQRKMENRFASIPRVYTFNLVLSHVYSIYTKMQISNLVLYKTISIWLENCFNMSDIEPSNIFGLIGLM